MKTIDAIHLVFRTAICTFALWVCWAVAVAVRERDPGQVYALAEQQGEEVSVKEEGR